MNSSETPGEQTDLESGIPQRDAGNREEPEILAKLGGDPRVYQLFSLAFTAFRYLPESMFNFTTGKSTRATIIEIVESFGFRAEGIPWERFPKRFHKNKPTLQLFKPELTDADIEQYWIDLIAAQEPGRAKRRSPKVSASVVVGPARSQKRAENGA